MPERAVSFLIFLKSERAAGRPRGTGLALIAAGAQLSVGRRDQERRFSVRLALTGNLTGVD